MAEYIDKHATAEHIDMYAKLLTMGDYRSGMMKAKEILLNQESVDIAQSIPKIIRGTDIVPVRLGEWLDGYKMQTCSLCKCRGKKSWTFCPHCGARMIYGERKKA